MATETPRERYSRIVDECAAALVPFEAEIMAVFNEHHERLRRNPGLFPGPYRARMRPLQDQYEHLIGEAMVFAALVERDGFWEQMPVTRQYAEEFRRAVRAALNTRLNTLKAQG